MLPSNLEAITIAALSLSEDDRVKLANDLLATLHGALDADVAAAWDVEICRRINEIEVGRVELLDAGDVIASARARLGL